MERLPVTKDLTGIRFTRWLVLEFAGYRATPAGKRTARWLCRCDCGTLSEIDANSLLSNNSKSCGCYFKDMMPTFNYKHGYVGTQEYHSWTCIKDRCYNQNSHKYKDYGAVGITMDEDLKEDFNKFLAEVGLAPTSFGKVTIDRIDNSKGYIKGNMRWATSKEQARNRGMKKTNKTGVTGVHLHKGSYIAAWVEFSDGMMKAKSKSFSVRKYGEDLAFKLDCEYRDAQINRLNSEGYGYTENHGK